MTKNIEFDAPNLEWEARVDNFWANANQLAPEDLRTQMDILAAELPEGHPIAAFERGSAFDSTGHSDKAVPLYQQALADGLDGLRRRRATIQLASSLRNMGNASESVALLTAEKEMPSDELDDAVNAFLALAMASEGQDREALALALQALAKHLPRYQISVGNYARLLIEDD